MKLRSNDRRTVGHNYCMIGEQEDRRTVRDEVRRTEGHHNKRTE